MPFILVETAVFVKNRQRSHKTYAFLPGGYWTIAGSIRIVLESFSLQYSKKSSVSLYRRRRPQFDWGCIVLPVFTATAVSTSIFEFSLCIPNVSSCSECTRTAHAARRPYKFPVVLYKTCCCSVVGLYPHCVVVVRSYWFFSPPSVPIGIPRYMTYLGSTARRNTYSIRTPL